MKDLSLRRTFTEKDKSESDGELLNGSIEQRGEADGDAVVEDVLLKVERSVRVLGWTAGSFSMQSVQNVKVSPPFSFSILHSSSAQSRLSPKTKVSPDMEVRTGKYVSAPTRRR
jgi:hypothetical protein